MQAVTDLVGPPPEVRRRLGVVPDCPGVYLFRDAQEQILYVGKSVHLRQRVRSYYQKGADEARKLRRLRYEARSLAWIVTGSELEALLLESRLVKRHLPRYNVLLRNYRNYPFIRVDFSEAYPRLEVTRVLQRDEARYYGPFSGAGAIEKVVETLSDALRLRTCEASGPALHALRPCLRRDFGRCDAPCAAEVDRERYRRAVEEACALFEGEGDRLFDLLQGRLEQAAERLQFELAARLRDAIRDIRRLVGKQQALLSAVRNLNMIAVCPSRRPDAVELFLFSAGRLLEQRELERATFQQPRAVRGLVKQMLARYQGSREQAGARVEQEVVDQINIVSDWLRRRSGEGRHLVLPERPEAGSLGRKGGESDSTTETRRHGGRTEAAREREVADWLKAAALEVAGSGRAELGRTAARGQLVLESAG